MNPTLRLTEAGGGPCAQRRWEVRFSRIFYSQKDTWTSDNMIGFSKRPDSGNPLAPELELGEGSCSTLGWRVTQGTDSDGKSGDTEVLGALCPRPWA